MFFFKDLGFRRLPFACPSPRPHTQMVPVVLPVSGAGRAGLALARFLQHLRTWQGGLSSLRLLRLGLSWQLGFGTKFASQVGGVLASLRTPPPPPHPHPRLRAVRTGSSRKAGLPAHQTFPSRAAAGACLFGVFGRSWGLGPKRHRVGLLVSVGLHPPIRHCPALCSLLVQSPRRDAPTHSGSAFSPCVSPTTAHRRR